MNVKIEFGPGPDDVSVDGETNAVDSPSELAAQLAFIEEASAGNFRTGRDCIAAGRGDPNCLRVLVPDGDAMKERELIDLQGGTFGATGPGNGNPVLSKRVSEYITSGTPAVPGTMAHRLLKPTLSALRIISGMPDAKVFFANDGSVAVDGAVRVALNSFVKRRGVQLDGADIRWNRYCIVAAENAYHGSGGFARSLFSSQRARTNFGPLATNVLSVPFGNLEALRRLFEPRSDCEIAAVILEPVQGAGGCVAPPEGYLAGVRELCREYGTVFIVDEIKSGFGRLGEFFYSSNIKPDLICAGKSAGAGLLPLSFVIGKPEIMEGFGKSTWGVTWSATPVQCVALLNLIQQLGDESPGRPSLLSEIRRKAAVLDALFNDLKRKYPRLIVTFDGLGLMRSLETVFPAREVVAGLRKRGVHTSGIVHPDKLDEAPKRVFVTPVLTITDEQIRAVVKAFDETIGTLVRQ